MQFENNALLLTVLEIFRGKSYHVKQYENEKPYAKLQLDRRDLHIFAPTVFSDVTLKSVKMSDIPVSF